MATKNVSWWKPADIKPYKSTLIPLKWKDYSYDTLGWGKNYVSSWMPSYNNHWNYGTSMTAPHNDLYWNRHDNHNLGWNRL